MSTFPVYGGPLAGHDTEDAPEMWTYRPGVMAAFYDKDAPAKEAPRYYYDLLDGPNGKAFLPREDKDLCAAYHETDGEPGDPAADALLAEIQRRNLDV